MDEKKIHTNFLNDESPVSIPSTDEAWENMRHKLAEDEKKKPFFLWKWYSAAGIVLLLTVGVWWSMQPGSRNDSRQHDIAATKSIAGQIAAGKDRNKEKSSVSKEKEVQKTSNSQLVNAKFGSKSPFHTSKKYKKKNVPSRRIKDRGKNAVEGKKNVRYTVFTTDSSAPGSNLFSKENRKTTEQPAADTNSLTRQSNDRNRPDTQVMKEAENEITLNDKTIEAGLFWSAQLPLSGTGAYFAGPGGSSQPYRLLLPGFYLGMQAEKLMFTIQVNPFAMSVLADKPYSVRNSVSGSDIIVERRTLHKIFGTTAGFAIDYNVKSRWWLGGNMQGNFWQAGAGVVQGEKTIPATGNAAIIYRNNYRLTDSAWSGFTKFQVSTGIQMLYKLRSWQFGARFDYYWAPLIDKAGQKNRTTAGFFIRRALYHNPKKS